MRILAGFILLLGTLAFLLAAVDLLEELPYWRRSLDHVPTVAQSAGVAGIGALLWVVTRAMRSVDE